MARRRGHTPTPQPAAPQPAAPEPAPVDQPAALARLEEERNRLMDSVASATFSTVETKIAWVLNNYPDTRNSDIALCLRYWQTFDDYDGGAIQPDDLYRMTRQTTLTRGRATIQNRLNLFQASPEVRARRGTLSEEERQNAVRTQAHPVFAVYADESGKTQQHYVVGSLWVLHGPETFQLTNLIREWRTTTGFNHELHFTDLNAGNIARYQEVIELVLANAAALSFKSATVNRAGAGAVQDAFRELFYQLTARGIDHESNTGRAPLPRSFQLWKDEEEAGYDNLLLANISDRLTARFQDQLVIDVVRAVPSRGNPLLQIADLFAGAVNRRLNPPNPPPALPGPKDEFSEYLLNRVGWAPADGDMAVSLSV